VQVRVRDDANRKDFVGTTCKRSQRGCSVVQRWNTSAGGRTQEVETERKGQRRGQYRTIYKSVSGYNN